MKKNFICLSVMFSFMFIGNIKALTTLDGQTLPDFPNSSYDYIIIKKNTTPYLIEIISGNPYMVSHDGIFGVNYNEYILIDNNWEINKLDFNNEIYPDSINGTTANIYSDETLQEISYSENYNLVVENNENNKNDSNLWTNIKGVITNIFILVGTLTSALLGNKFFQIILGIVFFGIGIGIIFTLVRKIKKHGK